ncbi:MAG: EndoU domain-containing protein [Clostridia bacterium]|nr:EndoU domain-containing protein [Clostridia bacterium]
MFKKIFISKKTQKHSSKGDFTYSKDGKREYKMTGGGHGQENINYLKSKGIKHNISFEYDNGVRRGNVSIHRRKNHKIGDMQCWFPKSWDRKDIANAGRYVMSLKKNKHREDGKTYWGTHKKVSVGVVTKKGFISSIFPNYKQKGVIRYNEKKRK